MFKRSAASNKLKTEPTHKDLMTVVNKESRFAKVKEKDTETSRMKREIMAHQGKQAVHDVPDQKIWKQGGHGYIDDKKPDDTIRVILENYNSLRYFSTAEGKSRIQTIDSTRKRLQADVMSGVEL